MRSVSQLMATATSMPAVEPLREVPVSPDTTEVVNSLFRSLRGIFPAWRQAWPSTEALAAAKEEWIKAFAAEGIRSLEQIDFGIQNCRKTKKPFAPSVGEFIGMCTPGPEAYGMPTAADAWLEALMGTASHDAVRIAANAIGLFDLRAAKQEDKAMRARFERNYEIVLRRAQANQPLDGKILTGIGHDSQKSELERAEEYANLRQTKLLEVQGIPSAGGAARAQLLARLNIKREPQRSKENF